MIYNVNIKGDIKPPIITDFEKLPLGNQDIV